jgi:4-amino-4-deoxy-L-arabinose transferase-like glycosyltransferase
MHSLRRLLLLFCGCAAVYFLFFHRLAERDLWSSHEARAAMDAQTILDDGAWGLPHLYDGREELQKPPLYYWLVAAIGRLRGGVDAWAVRLPAALAACGCLLVLVGGMAVARRRPVAGFLAAAILATALHFTWLARIGRIDMPLTLAVTVAAGAFYLRRRGGTWWWLLAGYLAIATGVLLKGPIGLVLPGAVLTAHLVVEGDWRPRRWLPAARRLGVWWGVPLLLAIALPWFVWAEDATAGKMSRVFLWYHNFGRGFGGTDLRSNPWWFYLPQFLGDFLPWSPLVVVAGVWCWRRPLLRRDPDARFGLSWFLAVLFVLSCVRFKRADYLLPAYPGAALFLGCVLRKWLGARSGQFRAPLWGAAKHRLSSRPPKGGAAVALLERWGVIGVVAATVAGWIIHVEGDLRRNEPFRDYRGFATEVRRLAPPPEHVVFFRTEAHALAFHVGRPLDVLVQWERLRADVAAAGTHYVVMPPGCVDDCRRHLPDCRLREVLRNTDLSGGAHERPLVLLAAEKIP